METQLTERKLKHVILQFMRTTRVRAYPDSKLIDKYKLSYLPFVSLSPTITSTSLSRPGKLRTTRMEKAHARSTKPAAKNNKHKRTKAVQFDIRRWVQTGNKPTPDAQKNDSQPSWIRKQCDGVSSESDAAVTRRDKTVLQRSNTRGTEIRSTPPRSSLEEIQANSSWSHDSAEPPKETEKEGISFDTPSGGTVLCEETTQEVIAEGEEEKTWLLNRYGKKVFVNRLIFPVGGSDRSMPGVHDYSCSAFTENDVDTGLGIFDNVGLVLDMFNSPKQEESIFDYIQHVLGEFSAEYDQCTVSSKAMRYRLEKTSTTPKSENSYLNMSDFDSCEFIEACQDETDTLTGGQGLDGMEDFTSGANECSEVDKPSLYPSVSSTPETISQPTETTPSFPDRLPVSSVCVDTLTALTTSKTADDQLSSDTEEVISSKTDLEAAHPESPSNWSNSPRDDWGTPFLERPDETRLETPVGSQPDKMFYDFAPDLCEQTSFAIRDQRDRPETGTLPEMDSQSFRADIIDLFFASPTIKRKRGEAVSRACLEEMSYGMVDPETHSCGQTYDYHEPRRPEVSSTASSDDQSDRLVIDFSFIDSADVENVQSSTEKETLAANKLNENDWSRQQQDILQQPTALMSETLSPWINQEESSRQKGLVDIQHVKTDLLTTIVTAENLPTLPLCVVDTNGSLIGLEGHVGKTDMSPLDIDFSKNSLLSPIRFPASCSKPIPDLVWHQEPDGRKHVLSPAQNLLYERVVPEEKDVQKDVAYDTYSSVMDPSLSHTNISPYKGELSAPDTASASRSISAQGIITIEPVRSTTGHIDNLLSMSPGKIENHVTMSPSQPVRSTGGPAGHIDNYVTMSPSHPVRSTTGHLDNHPSMSPPQPVRKTDRPTCQIDNYVTMSPSHPVRSTTGHIDNHLSMSPPQPVRKTDRPTGHIDNHVTISPPQHVPSTGGPTGHIDNHVTISPPQHVPSTGGPIGRIDNYVTMSPSHPVRITTDHIDNRVTMSPSQPVRSTTGNIDNHVTISPPQHVRSTGGPTGHIDNHVTISPPQHVRSTGGPTGRIDNYVTKSPSHPVRSTTGHIDNHVTMSPSQPVRSTTGNVDNHLSMSPSQRVRNTGRPPGNIDYHVTMPPRQPVRSTTGHIVNHFAMSTSRPARNTGGQTGHIDNHVTMSPSRRVRSSTGHIDNHFMMSPSRPVRSTDGPTGHIDNHVTMSPSRPIRSTDGLTGRGVNHVSTSPTSHGEILESLTKLLRARHEPEVDINQNSRGEYRHMGVPSLDSKSDMMTSPKLAPGSLSQDGHHGSAVNPARLSSSTVKPRVILPALIPLYAPDIGAETQLPPGSQPNNERCTYQPWKTGQPDATETSISNVVVVTKALHSTIGRVSLQTNNTRKREINPAADAAIMNKYLKSASVNSTEGSSTSRRTPRTKRRVSGVKMSHANMCVLNDVLPDSSCSQSSALPATPKEPLQLSGETTQKVLKILGLMPKKPGENSANPTKVPDISARFPLYEDITLLSPGFGEEAGLSLSRSEAAEFFVLPSPAAQSTPFKGSQYVPSPSVYHGLGGSAGSVSEVEQDIPLDLSLSREPPSQREDMVPPVRSCAFGFPPKESAPQTTLTSPANHVIPPEDDNDACLVTYVKMPHRRLPVKKEPEKVKPRTPIRKVAAKAKNPARQPLVSIATSMAEHGQQLYREHVEGIGISNNVLSFPSVSGVFASSAGSKGSATRANVPRALPTSTGQFSGAMANTRLESRAWHGTFSPRVTNSLTVPRSTAALPIASMTVPSKHPTSSAPTYTAQATPSQLIRYGGPQSSHDSATGRYQLLPPDVQVHSGYLQQHPTMANLGLQNPPPSQRHGQQMMTAPIQQGSVPSNQARPVEFNPLLFNMGNTNLANGTGAPAKSQQGNSMLPATQGKYPPPEFLQRRQAAPPNVDSHPYFVPRGASTVQPHRVSNFVDHAVYLARHQKRRGGHIQPYGGPVQPHGGLVQFHGGLVQSTGGPVQPQGVLVQSHGGLAQSHGGPVQSHGVLVQSHGGHVQSHGGLVQSHGGLVQSHGGLMQSHGGLVQPGLRSHQPHRTVREGAPDFSGWQYQKQPQHEPPPQHGRPLHGTSPSKYPVYPHQKSAHVTPHVTPNSISGVPAGVQYSRAYREQYLRDFTNSN